jgi:hypothetical protein
VVVSWRDELTVLLPELFSKQEVLAEADLVDEEIFLPLWPDGIGRAVADEGQGLNQLSGSCQPSNQDDH